MCQSLLRNENMLTRLSFGLVYLLRTEIYTNDFETFSITPAHITPKIKKHKYYVTCGENNSSHSGVWVGGFVNYHIKRHVN